MGKKIGILGGTFDPPHFGHLLIANEVLNKLNLNEIYFMLNQEPPHKERKSHTSTSERLQMLELAIMDHPAFSIEKIELERRGKSYTFDTMMLLSQRQPDVEFYFIIGADMVEYLPHWYKIDELINLVKFVGAGRPNYQLKSPYPVIKVDVPQVDISSTMIRERCKNGDTIRYLLPDNVMRFIKENRLYES